MHQTIFWTCEHMSVTKKNDFRVMTKKFGTLTRRADKSISSRLTLTEVVAILGTTHLNTAASLMDVCSKRKYQ